MGKSAAFEDLTPYLEKISALNTTQVLFGWDQETLAPKEAAGYTAGTIGILSGLYFELVTGAKVKKLLQRCEKEEALTELQKGIVKELKETAEKLECIPAGEYKEFAELTAGSARVWAKARQENDFASFAPVLKKILAAQKRIASRQAKKGQKLYDVMLDSYEKGFDMESLDTFFDSLRRELIPFLKKLTESGVQIEDGFLTGDFREEKQKELARFFAEYLGFDFNKGVLAVSAHPFTTNLHNHDVRITTAYSDHVDDSLFSVIHETGHALYELGIPDELTQTLLGTGTSMGMHESQSRFFENMIGRNPAFWKPVYGKMQETFPEQLGGVSREQFVRAVNRVRPGLIRTRADELTYSLHIMLRYEIEKMLVEENLEVEKLPQVWADKYEEYLGVRPRNDSEGVLQDIHWSQGSFGYFPSYALGSAFAAQLYACMRKQMDVETLLEHGDLAPIREFLRKNVHQFGKLKTSRQILRDVTGEDFNPDYYVEYLKEKYGSLYGI